LLLGIHVPGFRTIFQAWLSPENATRSIELAVNVDVFHRRSGSDLESVIAMTDQSAVNCGCLDWSARPIAYFVQIDGAGRHQIIEVDQCDGCYLMDL
jgi:hypothetical protein